MLGTPWRVGRSGALHETTTMELSPFWFGVYKLAKYVIYPYTWFLLLSALLLAATLGRVSTRRLAAVRLLAAALFLMLYVCATPMVAHVLIASLEQQYPPFDRSLRRDFGAIIVLAGAVLEKGSLRPHHELAASSAERTVCGADLYARGYASTVIFSGGDASIFSAGPQVAVEMKRLAVRLGIPEDAIVIENRSRTTYENAVETKRLIGARPALLVTSASHLPRAAALFQKQGIEITAVPCGYTAKDRTDEPWTLNPFDLLPNVTALEISTNAIQERVGIVIYRAMGKL
jgi:uncharacterized SAM-binding protein YcdF (DUF218 family)